MLPVRNKLEMLMGSNLVCLTDRDYMVYLQIRMLDDYEKAINKRIALRQVNSIIPLSVINYHMLLTQFIFILF